MSQMKRISEIPNFEHAHAKDIGLRRVSNGFVAWLEDGDGNQFSPPQWLLDLLHTAKEEGIAEGKYAVRRALRDAIGAIPDEPR